MSRDTQKTPVKSEPDVKAVRKVPSISDIYIVAKLESIYQQNNLISFSILKLYTKLNYYSDTNHF